jgi:hypothetical protein
MRRGYRFTGSSGTKKISFLTFLPAFETLCTFSEVCCKYLQSFKQHILESDPVRVRQIIERALEDASWVVKKVRT